MAYGTLSAAQLNALRPFVRGRTVHDLGAGDLVLADILLNLGAERIVAIDKRDDLPRNVARIRTVQAYFHEVKEPIGTAFASWPQNIEDYGLLSLAKRIPTFIYLGKNTDGSSCGGRYLFEYLATREVLAHVPEKANTLIVYGPATLKRERLAEEHASLTALERMWWYEELSLLFPANTV